ncbi:MAG: 1-acyl-sn-glycerol-3-phosphate acyltransferase [Actinobacteria bacterium]|nr:1-acyl-sn-glycerol-3-phosphate acyltransferase [Actinomycetota bacterium]
MPPRWLRRVLFGPALLTLVGFMLVSMPLAAVIAVIAVPFVPGRWRPLRILWFAFVYLLVEAVGLVAAFLLWIASGVGWKLGSPRFLDAHYRLLRLLLGFLVRSARWTFNLSIRVDERDLHSVGGSGRPPIIVLARHAGPGDSFLLVANLLIRGWRPRIVLKEALQWDPVIDVMLNRLPCRFIPPTREGRAATVPAIAELAGTMGPDDALVIFPEGGNFTEGRRRRSISKLEELGRHHEADRARSLRHVLAPRTTGALAAINAAPEAEVVFVAHTGLEDLSTPVDLWRGLPMDSDVVAKAWRVYPPDVPDEPDEQERWLFESWVEVDRWIVKQRGAEAVPAAIARRAMDLSDVELTPDDIGA